MNFKKNWKRFWTLNRHAEGFTLVELIVVIAILAILAAVAVPAYSAYVTKANKQADISLAAEIEQALWLAHYSGTLNEGVAVVVYYGENGLDVAVTDEIAEKNGTANTADAALIAAFGSNYASTLRLKYDGWDNNVAGDAEVMGIVKTSNFTPDSLDSLLSQVQVVVDAAANYLSNGGSTITEDAAALLQANGITVKAGDTLNETTGMATANAYVYLVAGELSNLNLSPSDIANEKAGEAETAFIEAWRSFDFSNTSGFDTATTAAAQYASIYALATYIDNATKGTDNPSDYTAQMNVPSSDPRIVANQVLADIKNSSNDAVVSAYNTYSNDFNSGYNDAVSFLAYMQGLTSSAGSLMQNTNLTNGQYFVDGYVADYVCNYINLSDVLTANGSSGSTLAFIYTGDEVLCMPLDYLPLD